MLDAWVVRHLSRASVHQERALTPWSGMEADGLRGARPRRRSTTDQKSSSCWSVTPSTHWVNYIQDRRRVKCDDADTAAGVVSSSAPARQPRPIAHSTITA